MAGTVEVIRGISLKNERPDIMLFDDIQSRVVAESQVQSETLEREMTGTAMKAKSPHGCLFLLWVICIPLNGQFYANLNIIQIGSNLLLAVFSRMALLFGKNYNQYLN